MDISALREFIEDQLKETACFLVDLAVSKENEIKVEIDSMDAVDIDRCIALTKSIEAQFDRDIEDYDLEVGSAGLTSPLRVEAQYRKNIGKKLDVLTNDGRKLQGELAEVTPDGIILRSQQKVKKEGEKRPVVEDVEICLQFSEIKKAVYHLEF